MVRKLGKKPQSTRPFLLACNFFKVSLLKIHTDVTFFSRYHHIFSYQEVFLETMSSLFSLGLIFLL